MAQKWGFGFKAGGSWTSIQGPLEPGETVGYQGGIHIGPQVTYKLLPKFGFYSGLAYNQAGSKYEYKGKGYFLFRSFLKDILVSGDVETKLLVEHSYVEIPLGIYYKPFKKLEVFGGVSLNILAGSTAKGTMSFNNPGKDLDFNVLLDYNYLKDKAGEVGGVFKSRVGYNYSKVIRGIKYDVPNTLGAYYFYNEEIKKKKYNTLDYGVLAGLKYYLNSALYLSLRGYWGLSDITNNSVDLKYTLDPNAPDKLPKSSDIDKNIVYQLSLGFAF